MKKQKTYYVVTGFLYRDKYFREYNKIYFEEIFKEKNNNESRAKAMKRFESILEVLLESKNLKYKNDEQAHQDLREFYDSEHFENIPEWKRRARKKDQSKFITIGFYKKGECFLNHKIIRAFGKDNEMWSTDIFENLEEEKMFL